MAYAIAITTAMTALAQDSPRFRTPHRAFEGAIERRYAVDIADAIAAADANTAQGPANLDQNGNLIFEKGTVDFSPVRSVTPGPKGREFPPTASQPGAVGDKDYSPFVQIANAGGVIYNAPIVAFGVNASDINFPG